MPNKFQFLQQSSTLHTSQIGRPWLLPSRPFQHHPVANETREKGMSASAGNGVPANNTLTSPRGTASDAPCVTAIDENLNALCCYHWHWRRRTHHSLVARIDGILNARLGDAHLAHGGEGVERARHTAEGQALQNRLRACRQWRAATQLCVCRPRDCLAKRLLHMQPHNVSSDWHPQNVKVLCVKAWLCIFSTRSLRATSLRLQPQHASVAGNRKTSRHRYGSNTGRWPPMLLPLSWISSVR